MIFILSLDWYYFLKKIGYWMLFGKIRLDKNFELGQI